MRPPEPEALWMPDVCRTSRIAIMLGLAELVVIVVVLVPNDHHGWPLSRFAYASGFALWMTLAITVLLCRMRRIISRMPKRLGGLSAIALSGGVAATFSWIVYSIYDTIGEPLMALDTTAFVTRTAAVAMLITALALRYFYVSDRWAAQLAAQARAEADALQARIRPHFLFNSMNLIAGLVRRDPEVAEHAILDLSDLFRAALGAGDGESTLRAECELVDRYLAIETLRLGNRLQVQWNKQEPLPWSLPMPRLTLQPLVENAVLHGISLIPEGGRITLDLRVDGEKLHIRITNPIPASIPDAHILKHQGTGHAQRNIALRLEYRYGARAQMIRDRQDDRYACEIVIPAQ